MVSKEEFHSMLAKKQAGVNRMLDRQKRVHQRMAQLVEDRPELIEDALKKVKQRLENSCVASKEIHSEWYQILTTWSIDKIVAMLRDDSPKTEQLRACAPFDFVNA